MITQIHIANLITIQAITLDFHSGMTVITGETGAGKSVLLEAIELVLGARADNSIIRAGQDKADISICFDVSKLTDVKSWLRKHDLENGNECLIRRTISKEGPSRSYINGMPMTLQLLRELSELLIYFHGQHENQALLRSSLQRDMVDRFAGNQNLLSDVSALSEKWHHLSTEIIRLKKISAESSAHSDFLKFQMNELETLNLQAGEFEKLDLAHKQLAHADQLLQNISFVINKISEDENGSVIASLNECMRSLENIQRIDPKLANCNETVNTVLIQINDVEHELRNYLDKVNLDPEQLQKTEQRISQLFDMARKYKVQPNELYELQQRIAKEYSENTHSDERLNELEQEMQSIVINYNEVAAKLTASRKKAAKKLEKEITQIVRKLALPHAELQISLEEEKTLFSANGKEKINFIIKINAGTEFQALAKAASGGELSRISLAIHMATAEQQTIPTLLFDEVDVGIGGGTAEVVGKLLRDLGKNHQIFCITHAPQVAAQGHHHLRVEKSNQKNSTTTAISYLKSEERINEIARMLGGVKITDTTLAHAREMIGETIA